MTKITVVTTCLKFDLTYRGEGYNRKTSIAFRNRKAAELHAKDLEALYENALEEAQAYFDDDHIENAYIDEVVIQTVDLW